MRGLGSLRGSLFRAVRDPRLHPGSVDVLEVVVLKDGRKLRRKTLEAEVARLGNHPEGRLHHLHLLSGHHETLLKVVLGEQDLVRL